MKIRKYIGEIFSLVNQETETKNKIKILRENQSAAMMELFRFAYDPSYVSLVKEVPKYKVDDSPYGYSYSDLQKEYIRINYFFDYPNKNKSWQIAPRQRHRILVNMLERIHWSDSAILSAILLEKKIPNIPLELVQQAFPKFTISTNKGSTEENSHE